MPVVTDDDRHVWEQWRRERKRELQRQRRASNRRIDYYPDAQALAIIESLAGRGPGDDLSSVINRLIAEALTTTEAAAAKAADLAPYLSAPAAAVER